MKILFAILILAVLSACTATIPLGKDARYGVVGLTVSYQPPINILAEQPNIGGFAK
jgi:hypothetical protein